MSVAVLSRASRWGVGFTKIKINMTSQRLSSDMADFKEKLKSSQHIVILTGAGVSAESGIPTFRGAGGLWRRHQATSLATPEAFAANPSLVWEFYHYRREVARKAEPNAVSSMMRSLPCIHIFDVKTQSVTSCRLTSP